MPDADFFGGRGGVAFFAGNKMKPLRSPRMALAGKASGIFVAFEKSSLRWEKERAERGAIVVADAAKPKRKASWP